MLNQLLNLPACVALFALAQQCLWERRGRGSEIKHGGDRAQQVSRLWFQGAKRLQLLCHVLDGRHLRRQKRQSEAVSAAVDNMHEVKLNMQRSKEIVKDASLIMIVSPVVKKNESKQYYLKM